jgi:hypothetical protein
MPKVGDPVRLKYEVLPEAFRPDRVIYARIIGTQLKTPKMQPSYYVYKFQAGNDVPFSLLEEEFEVVTEEEFRAGTLLES